MKPIIYFLRDEINRSDGNMTQFFMDSDDKNNFDLIVYVTYPGAEGYAWRSQICIKSSNARYSFNKGYGPGDCDKFDPPEPIECNPTNRIALTAEVIEK